MRTRGVVRNYRPAWSGGAAALFVGVLAAVLVVFGGDFEAGPPKRHASPGFALTGGTVPLWPVPATVVRACRQAQAHASFMLLCPSRLPRATRDVIPWEPPAPLEVSGSPEALDFSYGAPVAGLGTALTLTLDRPERFLHFVVGLATEGVPSGARRARVGRRWGMLAPASAVARYVGAYFADHVRFVWREHGVRYGATLHTFGERAATELLGRIVAGLVPASRLAAVEQPQGSALVGPAPTGVAADGTGLWVATAGAIATGLNGRLVRFDRVSLRPSARPMVRPKGIRVAVGEGAVWTVSYDVKGEQNVAPPELARVNPVTGRVTARLGLGPGEGTGIAVGGGSVWITRDPPDPRSPSMILRVDPGTMRVLTRTRVGRGAASVAVDGRSVWVVNATSNTLSRLNASSGGVTATVPVGQHPFGIAVGSGSVWVTNVTDGTVSRVDARSDRVTATIPVGRAPYGVTINSHDVWVAVLGTGTLVKIDPNTNRIAELVHLRGDPLAIAADGRLLYVTLNTEGLLLRVDPATLPR